MDDISDFFQNNKLDTITIPESTSLFRCFNTNHKDALFFAVDGRPHKNVYSGRFGDINRNEGVCYLGLSEVSAIVETLLQANMVFRGVALAKLASIGLVDVALKRKLTLVNLSGAGLHKNQVTAAVTNGPHEDSRIISTAILSNPLNYDGIYWRSKINNDQFNVAIFERAQMVLQPAIVLGSLADDGLIDYVADVLEEHKAFLY